MVSLARIALPYALLPTWDILLDNTALRATNKLNELIALGTLGNLGLGLIATSQVVKLALEQDAARIVDRLNLLVAKAATRKTDLINASVVSLAISSDDIGWHILSDKRSALNHSVVADMYPLVQCRVATDNNPVAYLDLASKRHAVSDDAVAADNVVVGNVNIGHKQVMVTDDGSTA